MSFLYRFWPRTRMARREALAFYAFISPWLIGFLVFTLYPMLASAYYSFTVYNVVEMKFAGLQNYQELITDKKFYWSLWVTAKYTLVGVPLGIASALVVAVLLNQKVPFLSFWRTLYYLPSVITGVAVAMLWQWVLNPEYGMFNYLVFRPMNQLAGTLADWVASLLKLPLLFLWADRDILDVLYRVFELLAHLQGPRWFWSETWVIPAYWIMGLWGIGGTMVIYLAGLQGVPTALYEAAEIDGASSWQRFWKITIPMISPVILFTLITNLIGALQMFTQAYVISNGLGGPNNASLLYVLYLFLNGFRWFRFGYASALAWVLFAVIITLTLVLLRVLRNVVYYETPGA